MLEILSSPENQGGYQEAPGKQESRVKVSGRELTQESASDSIRPTETVLGRFAFRAFDQPADYRLVALDLPARLNHDLIEITSAMLA